MQTVKKGSWQKTQLALQECTKCGIEKPAKSLDSLGICKGGCGGQVAPVANRGIQAEAEQPLVWLTKIMRQVISAQPEFERRMPENVGSVEVGLSEYCQLAAKAIYETLSGMQLQEKTGQEAILRKEIARLHEQIAKLEALHQKDGQAFEEMLPDVGKAAGLQLEVDALRARKDQLQNAVYVKEREIEALRAEVDSLRQRIQADANNDSRKTAQKLAEILSELAKKAKKAVEDFQCVPNPEWSNKQVIDWCIEQLVLGAVSYKKKMKELQAAHEKIRETCGKFIDSQSLAVEKELRVELLVEQSLLQLLHQGNEKQVNELTEHDANTSGKDRTIRLEAENAILRGIVDRLLPTVKAPESERPKLINGRRQCTNCPNTMAKSVFYSNNGLCYDCRAANEQAPDEKPGPKSHTRLCVKCKRRTAKRADGKCVQCHQKDKGGAKQTCGPVCPKCKKNKPGKWFGENGICLKCEGAL